MHQPKYILARPLVMIREGKQKENRRRKGTHRMRGSMEESYPYRDIESFSRVKIKVGCAG